MIYPSGATRVFLVPGATDMRKSFNGLHALVEYQLREDPLSGHLFAFCNRQRNRLKVLCWDGTGLWVCAKRLERGTFTWPTGAEPSVRLCAEAWSMLLGGLDTTCVRVKNWYRKSA